ncbi:DUF5412 family protein [Aureibacillus halotolerans]|uniref:Uncharacterized protein n=1 Tax=Aureibacillus halotolerans TaxID=1508390 RepID=A0A4R6U7W4_9BACI|nr:DUF5412 family protein [Aureibacillus halotolerans]TDQ41023.1 hypothetical protein EV213_10420 [Aureibacillus halotolerans]
MNGTLYTVLFLLFFVIAFIAIVLTVVTAKVFIKNLIKHRKANSIPKKLVVSTIVFVCFTGFLFYQQYYNLEYLPAGHYNGTFVSPEGTYEVRTYYMTVLYGEHATAILYEKESNKQKTIYFNDCDHRPSVKWLSEHEVKVGSATLNLEENETYDFRHDPTNLCYPPTTNL